jgi:hypothetical protein
MKEKETDISDKYLAITFTSRFRCGKTRPEML